MATPLDEFRIQEHFDHGSVEAEWQVMKYFLEKDPAHADTLWQYIFNQYRGYVDNRVRAGLTVLRMHPSGIWQMLERLVHSDDPDDRDTALQVLIRIADDNAQQLALSLIGDIYPYIAFDAIDFIKDSYQPEARVALERLSRHNEHWAVEAAKDRLMQLDKGSVSNDGQ